MVDLEPLLDAPFESASNLSFEALLVAGIGLLAIVAAVGRSPATMGLAGCYLLAIPAYVAYRIRIWDGGEDSESNGGDEPDGAGDSHDGSDDGSRTG